MKWNGEIPLKKKRNRTSNEKQDPKSLYLLFCFSLGSSNPVQKTNVQRPTSNIQYPMKSKSPGTVWSLAFHSDPRTLGPLAPLFLPSNSTNSMNPINPMNIEHRTSNIERPMKSEHSNPSNSTNPINPNPWTLEPWDPISFELNKPHEHPMSNVQCRIHKCYGGP